VVRNTEELIAWLNQSFANFGTVTNFEASYIHLLSSGILGEIIQGCREGVTDHAKNEHINIPIQARVLVSVISVDSSSFHRRMLFYTRDLHRIRPA
jgi:hypothetical protein